MGPSAPGWWQTAQCSNRIGATSRLNVRTSARAWPATPCAASIPTARHNPALRIDREAPQPTPRVIAYIACITTEADRAVLDRPAVQACIPDRDLATASDTARFAGRA